MKYIDKGKQNADTDNELDTGYLNLLLLSLLEQIIELQFCPLGKKKSVYSKNNSKQRFSRLNLKKNIWYLQNNFQIVCLFKIKV